MKTEAKETGPPTDGDPYVSAAAALDQAQRSLFIAQAQLKTPTISVAVAEQRMEALRSEIVALKVLVERDRVEIEGLRKVAADAKQALDLARSDAEEPARVAVKAAHERERLALAASVKNQHKMKKEQEALAKEREVLNKQRIAFEAEQKGLLDDRTQLAEKLQDMSQLVRPNPLLATPQAATLPPAGPSSQMQIRTPSHRWVTTSSLYPKQMKPTRTRRTHASAEGTVIWGPHLCPLLRRPLPRQME
ncbi:hypothetical protein B0H11DRAFT_2129981 [Mycena galericulata]|nr:hypothetical protein B0H11DRAFT_2129981 [Mycena galericulata]